MDRGRGRYDLIDVIAARRKLPYLPYSSCLAPSYMYLTSLVSLLVLVPLLSKRFYPACGSAWRLPSLHARRTSHGSTEARRHRG